MKIDRNEASSDGITKVSRPPTFHFDGSPTTPAQIAEFDRHFKDLLRVSSFDGKVSDLEAWLRRVPRTPNPRYGSKAWYAADILQALARVREERTRGNIDLALAGAVDVGLKWKEMVAKGWPIVERGRAIDAGGKRGAQVRGFGLRVKAADADVDIYRLWDACATDDLTDSAKHAVIARQLKREKNITKSPRTIRRRLALRSKP